MAIGKQSKTLSKAQTDAVTTYLGTRRYGIRDQTIFLLSIKAELRAKEIAHMKWSMVLGSDGTIGDAIHHSLEQTTAVVPDPIVRTRADTVSFLMRNIPHGDVRLSGASVGAKR